jgi:hypothetical protein
VVLDEKIPTFLEVLQGVHLAGWPRVAARKFPKTGTAVIWKCHNWSRIFFSTKWRAAILTSGYLIDPESVPDSSIYLHKPWSLDDLVITMATLLKPGIAIYKA